MTREEIAQALGTLKLAEVPISRETFADAQRVIDLAAAELRKTCATCLSFRIMGAGAAAKCAWWGSLVPADGSGFCHCRALAFGAKGGEVMEETRMVIVDEIDAERDRQDAQWGGPEHDDEHTVGHWFNFIDYQSDRWEESTSIAESRERLVKIAALAIAGIESIDRNRSPR